MQEGWGEKNKNKAKQRSTNWWSQNIHGDVKSSTGNGVAKEFIYMTHGHEQWCGDCLKGVRVMGGVDKGGKIGTTVTV